MSSLTYNQFVILGKIRDQAQRGGDNPTAKTYYGFLRDECSIASHLELKKLRELSLIKYDQSKKYPRTSPISLTIQGYEVLKQTEREQNPVSLDIEDYQTLRTALLCKEAQLEASIRLYVKEVLEEDSDLEQRGRADRLKAYDEQELERVKAIKAKLREMILQ